MAAAPMLPAEPIGLDELIGQGFIGQACQWCRGDSGDHLLPDAEHAGYVAGQVLVGADGGFRIDGTGGGFVGNVEVTTFSPLISS
ncbi:hypothetical protein [Spelaeicoccus albus]|uniref:Uncharacterized protein n=1 Tax=Spelaeicoccus albus TaxID=1280376 RepID=A0A7Z0IHK8_9MICO|nr:hypothetical protein [Spelaeicoccus albus]NYI67790.1 hypothetical protein [Spelaeicoccus albus]